MTGGERVIVEILRDDRRPEELGHARHLLNRISVDDAAAKARYVEEREGLAEQITAGFDEMRATQPDAEILARVDTLATDFENYLQLVADLDALAAQGRMDELQAKRDSQVNPLAASIVEQMAELSAAAQEAAATGADAAEGTSSRIR